jgi:imidazolonepropionase
MEPTAFDRLWLNARLATFDPRVSAPCGILEGHALAVRGDRIAAVLPADSPEVNDFRGPVTYCGGKLITPGFIDCHTHLVWGGSRAGEWEMRLAGVPYTEIARRGGGILSTVAATRAMTEADLLEAALPRLRSLIAEGVTCVEIKSGYGLTVADELKMLRVARALGENLRVEVSPTLLAAHAVPPEFAGRADDYVSLIVDEMIPAVAEEKLADAVDVFCETIAFTPAQCERIFAAAKENGLAVKGHVEQLSHSRGAELVARYFGWSADHLEHLDGPGVKALAQAGTVAVLLPTAFYFLREKLEPPCAALLASGVPMAVGSDLNPGTSPFASLRLAMNMACVLYGLTPEEALFGVTRAAARALGRLGQMGTLEAGKRADFLVWDVAHPAEIVCQLGVTPIVERVVWGSSTRPARTEAPPPGAPVAAPIRGAPAPVEAGAPREPVSEYPPDDLSALLEPIAERPRGAGPPPGPARAAPLDDLSALLEPIVEPPRPVPGPPPALVQGTRAERFNEPLEAAPGPPSELFSEPFDPVPGPSSDIFSHPLEPAPGPLSDDVHTPPGAVAELQLREDLKAMLQPGAELPFEEELLEATEELPPDGAGALHPPGDRPPPDSKSARPESSDEPPPGDAIEWSDPT